MMYYLFAQESLSYAHLKTLVCLFSVHIYQLYMLIYFYTYAYDMLIL